MRRFSPQSIFCALTMAFSSPSWAEEGVAGQWALDMEVGASQGGSLRSYVLVERGFGQSTYLFSGLGQTQVNSETLDLDTRMISLGGRVGLTPRWDLGGWYERWGRPGDISSDSLTGRLGMDLGSIRWSVVPGLRAVTLHAGAPASRPGEAGGPPPHVGGPPRREGEDGEEIAEDFDLLGASLGLRFRQSLGEDWAWRASGTWYDYDHDPAVLANRRGVEHLSTSALTLAQGFPDYRYGLGVSRSLAGWREIGLNIARDRSAVDGLISDTVSVYFLTPFSDAWDVELEVGSARTETFGHSGFAALILSWYP